MLHNLKIVFRHLSRQKLNTSLHITGLTLGITVCILITLFIQYELSFDAYHEKAERTYRIISKWDESGKVNYHFSTPFPLANAVRTEMSGIENVSFAHPVYTNIVEVSAQKKFREDKVLAVEPEFLELFNLEPLKGDLYKTLRKPYQAILTESTARKFFGNEDPIGKTIGFKSGGTFEFTISAIVKDMPPNTHLPVNVFVSHAYTENFLKDNLDGWSYVSGTETLVSIPKNTDLKIIQSQLTAIANKHLNSDPNMPKFYKSDFELQRLDDVHFNGELGGGGHWVQSVSKSWLWFFGAIGAAVLALACINFMNLSTAQALTRAKEVGVRKSVGAGKFNLITQFLSEAWTLTFISGILAIALSQLCLPYLNSLLDKRISFDLMNSPVLLSVILVGIIVTGLLAGIYPAWVISKFNPALTLKGSKISSAGDGSNWLRKGLVVAQFTISVGLLMVVILIAQQVSFMRSKSLGFNKDNVINVDIQSRTNKHEVFRNELSKITAVTGVSFATATPSNAGHWGTIMTKTNRDDKDRHELTLIFADDNFCKMYGMKLLAGRLLEARDTSYSSRLLPSEQRVMRSVVNETLIRDMGFESNSAAIGKNLWMGMNGGNVEIIGVVSDFNTGSLREAIKPTLITPNAREYEQAGIKIEAGSNVLETIAAIETAWKVAYPEGIFSYKFLDEQIDSFYMAEQRLFILFKIFSGLAMFISCLGLWGLATYAAQSRTKEIGIRKVLGASVKSIVGLLSKDFAVLVLIALVIATPIALYGITQWLQDFAYRIEISWWVFGLVGLTAIVIAVTTVSTQAIKAAISNPTESLRSE
ncbi:MAG: ABC transporter permease [Bacteroidetes bacterium]|nr:ABC transporter permease [Bacteroidota bacterium]